MVAKLFFIVAAFFIVILLDLNSITTLLIGHAFILFGYYALERHRGLALDFKPTFIALYTLYGVYGPVTEFVLHGYLDSTAELAARLYMSSTLLLVSVFFLVPTSNIRIRRVSGAVNSERVYTLLILLMIYKVYYIYNEIGPTIFTSYGSERLTEIGQLWIVVNHIVTGLFIYYLSRRVDVKILFLFLVFVTISLSIGNRREFVPALIVVAYLFVRRFRVQNNIFMFLLTILAFNVFSFSSLFRGDSNAALIDGVISNEFVYPFYTLLSAVDSVLEKGVFQLHDIVNYFLPLVIWIPRLIWDGKPSSLAMEFVNSQGTEMGYAYMPLSEYVLLYGALYFVPMCLFALALAVFSRVRGSVIYLIVLSMMPDICRGESQAIFFQFVIIYVAYCVAGIRYVSGNSYVSR